MKRILFMLLLVTILFSCKREAPRVLLFIKDGSTDLTFMLTKEVGTMKQILEQAGMKVSIATVSGKVIKSDSVTVTPDIKASDVKIEDYAGFLFPCMATDTVQPEAVLIVKKAVNENKPVAAQLGSVVILGEAGVLNGKKFAFLDEKDMNAGRYPKLKEGVFSGSGVVIDGNIITSGVCPDAAKIFGLRDGTTELTQKLIEMIKVKTK